MASITVRPLVFGDQEVLVSVVPVTGTEKTSTEDRLKANALDALTRARSAILAVAATGAEVVKDVAHKATRPETVEVELGFAFSASGNIIIAGAGIEASILVRFHYQVGAKQPATKNAGA